MPLKPVTYIPSLTPLRGIAAILVVLYHFDVFLRYHKFPQLIDTNMSSLFVKGYLWVDFFFILSGFVICHVYGKTLEHRSKTVVKSYLWARFTRLYPLHVFIMLLFLLQTVLLVYFFPDYASEHWVRTFSDFMIHLFFLQTSGLIDHLAWNVASWSIAAEWWTYIIAIGLIPFLNKSSKTILIIAMVLAVSGYVFISSRSPNLSINSIYALGTLRCVFGFTIGIGVYHAYLVLANKTTLWNTNWWLCLCFISALLVLHFNLYDVLVIPLFGGCILCASLNTGWPSKILNSKPLLFLGHISYSIYMIHLFWLTLWWMWLDLYFIPTHPDIVLGLSYKLLWLSVLMTLIISSSYLTYTYVEIPAQKKLRQWQKS